VPEIKAVQTLH